MERLTDQELEIVTSALIDKMNTLRIPDRCAEPVLTRRFQVMSDVLIKLLNEQERRRQNRESGVDSNES